MRGSEAPLRIGSVARKAIPEVANRGASYLSGKMQHYQGPDFHHQQRPIGQLNVLTREKTNTINNGQQTGSWQTQPQLTLWPPAASFFFLLARVLLSLVFRAALSTYRVEAQIREKVTEPTSQKTVSNEGWDV